MITQVKETCHTSREQEHLSWRVIKSCAALPLEPTKLNNQHMVLEIPTLAMVTTRYPGMEGGGGGPHGGGLVVGQPPNHNQPPPLNHQPLGLAAPRPLSHHQVVNVLCLFQNMKNTLTSFQLVGLPGYTGYHRPEELASLYR